MTTKELTALEESLDGEQVLVKKYQTMANQASDPVIKNKFSDIASKHQGHYDKLLSYLA